MKNILLMSCMEGECPLYGVVTNLGSFIFFREYPTLDLMAVYLGELSE
jgi:hypothetical protein